MFIFLNIHDSLNFKFAGDFIEEVSMKSLIKDMMNILIWFLEDLLFEGFSQYLSVFAFMWMVFLFIAGSINNFSEYTYETTHHSL